MLRIYFFLVLGAVAIASLLPDRRPEDSAARAEPAAVQVVEADRSFAQLGQPQPDGSLTLHRQLDGHFYVDAAVNGTIILMLVDTGASGIALTRDDARRAGIGISIGMPDVVGEGAGAAVKGEYVMLDQFSLGRESARNLPAVVLDGGGQSLLGQSFLKQFSSVEIKGDRMVLR